VSERVAIVAGAGGGPGRATAEKVAAAGFTVAGVNRGEQGRQQGGPCPPHPALDLELRPLGIRERRSAAADRYRQIRPYLTPDLLAHAVAPEAVAGIVVYLVSDAAAPVSGAVMPAYGT